MEACLGEELQAPTELEEALRNGVILAKLGHRFAPNAVPLKKIYDPEQRRYQVTQHRLTSPQDTQTRNMTQTHNTTQHDTTHDSIICISMCQYSIIIYVLMCP